MPPAQLPPTSVPEALERAREHVRAAGIELLTALRALLDAAALGWTGKPSDAHATLRTIAHNIDDVVARLDDGWIGIPAPAMNAVLQALDQEIARWQERSLTDVEARAVLRTFLGLREILWEFGVRPGQAPEPRAPTRAAARTRAEDRKEATVSAATRRVQRVEVQGQP